MLLANDSDPNSSGALSIDALSETSALGAQITFLDGSITYDPSAVAAFQALRGGEIATDTFTYTVSDGLDASSEATVTVKVTGINDAPVLNSFTLTILEGGTTVLSNGDLDVTDPDSTSFFYSVQNVTGGQFEVLNGDDDWVSAPTGGFTDAQIAAGGVRFVHDGGEAAPDFQSGQATTTMSALQSVRRSISPMSTMVVAVAATHSTCRSLL